VARGGGRLQLREKRVALGRRLAGAPHRRQPQRLARSVEVALREMRLGQAQVREVARLDVRAVRLHVASRLRTQRDRAPQRRHRPLGVATPERRDAGTVRLVPLLRVGARRAERHHGQRDRRGPAHAPARHSHRTAAPSCAPCVEKAGIVAAGRLTRLVGRRYAVPVSGVAGRLAALVLLAALCAAGAAPCVCAAQVATTDHCGGSATGFRASREGCACPCMTAGGTVADRSDVEAAAPLPAALASCPPRTARVAPAPLEPLRDARPHRAAASPPSVLRI
jgi:hypothetical protein